MPESRSSIPTTYKGQELDSLLEGRWAAFFDLLGWEWEPQPETQFGVWRPDFRLTIPGDRGDALVLYVEVKPREHIQEAWERIDQSSYAGAALIVTDRPYESSGHYAIGQLRQGRASQDAFIVEGHQQYEELNGYWNTIENSIQPRPKGPRPGELPPKLFRIDLRESQPQGGRSWTIATAPPGDRSPAPPPQQARDGRGARSELEAPPPTEGPRDTGPRRRLLLGVGVSTAVVAALVVIVLLVWRPFDETFEDRDCADFSTWSAAQSFYREQGGPDSDPHHLDNNRDGIACEGLRAR